MAVNETSYLILGHLTQDFTPEGVQMGGTVAYSGLTASALGCAVRMVTVYPQQPNLPVNGKLAIHCYHTSKATQFENSVEDGKRTQY